jgi:GT2 family glycosyltransferase
LSTRRAGRIASASLVVVAHRSAACLPTAIEGFRSQAASCGLAAEVVVVEQSEDEEQLHAAETCRPDRLLALPNRGFAAGVNAGTRVATGEVQVVANPDVALRAGALAALIEALESGWEIVGPQFVLGDFLLPAADRQTPPAELARQVACRWPRLGRAVLAREARHWCRVWEAHAPQAQQALSGALLAYRRETARRVGPWEEGYFLYFEEMDWLHRARQGGTAIALVPSARAEHNWGHAADPTRFAGRFHRSRRRYYRRTYPILGRLVARRQPPARAVELEPWSVEAASQLPAGVWWLLASDAGGLPSAGTRLGADRLPAAVAGFLALRPGFPDPVLSAFAADRGGLLGRWAWHGGRGGRC